MRSVKKISKSISSLPKSFGLRSFNEKETVSRRRHIKQISSVSNLQKINSNLFDREESVSSIPSMPRFLPKNRYYVQLSPSKNEYDLKGKSIEQDRKSVDKLLNNDLLIKKASDLKLQLKLFNLKSARFSLMKRIEYLKTPVDKIHIHKTETFFREIKSGNLEKIQEMLQEDRSLIHLFDSTKQTALHWATRRGYIEIVKLLIKNGASILAIDMMGRTPDDIARSKKFYEIIEIFGNLKRISRQSTLRCL